MAESPRNSTFTYRPIGIIHSPHLDPHRTPIQPIYAKGIKGRVEIFAEYEVGLQDIDGFSHIHLVYPFRHAGPAALTVTPFLEEREHGVFATRAPCRPNPVGISLVRLVARDGCILQIEDVDVLDGTPLFDIKPYIARYDSRADSRNGWQEDIDEETARIRGRRGYDDDPGESERP